MITIEAWIEGTFSILLKRATEESLSGKTRSNTPGESEDPRDICERHVYRLPKTGALCLPGSAFARMLREAGGSHKAKGSRKSLKYIVPAACVVLDELCPIFLNDRVTPVVDFEVDSRPVTIPSTKGKIMGHRARLNEWSTCVHLRLKEHLLDEAMLRKLLTEGAEQIGLGDYRPEKGGPFGTSALVEWQVISEPKPRTIAQLRAAG